MMTIASCARTIGCLVAVAAMVATFPACSPTPKNQKSDKQAPAGANSGAEKDGSAAEPAPVVVTVSKIQAADDIFAWHTLHSAYTQQGKTNQELDAAFAEKKKALLPEAKPIPLADGLELVAFDWELQGDKSVEGKKEDFTASWLFHKTKETGLGDDRVVLVVFRGWVDEAHQEYLKGSGSGDGRYFERTYTLDPGIDEWPVGEYTLVTRSVGPLPNLPYRMHCKFPTRTKTADGTLAHAPDLAHEVDLGWFVDLGEEAPASATGK